MTFLLPPAVSMSFDADDPKPVWRPTANFFELQAEDTGDGQWTRFEFDPSAATESGDVALDAGELRGHTGGATQADSSHEVLFQRSAAPFPCLRLLRARSFLEHTCGSVSQMTCAPGRLFTQATA